MRESQASTISVQSNLIYKALESSKINFWEWEIETNRFFDFGWFNSFSHFNSPDNCGTLENLIEITHPEYRQKAIDAFNQCLSDKDNIEVELLLLTEKNTYQEVFVRGHLVLSETGKLSKIVGTFIGTSHCNKIELAEMKRISSIGLIASVLAHELSQPLMVINTYMIGGIRRIEQSNFSSLQTIPLMKKVIEYVGVLENRIHHIKNFIYEEKNGYENADIVCLLNEAILFLLQEKYIHTNDVVVDCQDDIPLVSINKIQIKQVLLNLIYYSVEAIHRESLKKFQIKVKIRKTKHHFIRISIYALGFYISDDVINFLFTPNLSIKKNKFELRLANCRTIVEAHGGCLSVRPLKNNSIFQFTIKIRGEENG